MASSTGTLGMEYDVFLSFRGPDTRDNFTSCLYRDMFERGIRVFKDDQELEVGEKIEALLQALKDSQIYIPIFSKDFASSAWCLREVALMVDCTSESDGKKDIFPLFLDVKPEDVKSRTGLYSEALSKHEEKYGADEVKRWRDALREVATRFGRRRDGKEDGDLMKLIVRKVQLKLTGKDRSLPHNLVEMDDEGDIEELLDVNSREYVLFVIIHGTGGIGKSTLAKVIFNRFWSKFDYRSFLEDVQGHDLLDMQKKLLSETLNSTSAQEIYDTNDGINRIRRGLSNKRVLVVVDNVVEENQLKNLAGSCNWFGPGSRIIVTARDTSKIKNEDIKTWPGNYLAYSVKEMPLDRAIQLFNRHAFNGDTPLEDCSDLSAEVIVSSVGRLPLTLEVVGSLFASTCRSEWEKTWKDLIQVPHRNIQETLKISFDKLDTREQDIFLDIACFCIGEDQTHAYYMWDDCGYSPHSAIQVLRLMSLIKIDENNKFRMHDELRDLGRYIVKIKNVRDAGKRPWVWIDAKTSRILRSNKEKPDVRALSLGIDYDLTPEELAHFTELTFLGGERVKFVGNFKDSLPELRWLSWHHCPVNLGATNLCPESLVVLDLSQSDITHDWVGWSQIKEAKTLKVLDLTRCEKLTTTPDFSKFGNLEILILAGCVKLSTIDSSIGELILLHTLNIKGCISLQGLPEEIGSLECLSKIIMPSVTPKDKPFKLPETLGNLKSLTTFDVRGHYGISQIPHSIGRLTNLTKLILRDCKYLNELPDSIGELKSLVELDLEQSHIQKIPNSIGNLKRLEVIRVGHTKVETIPSTIGGVEMLEELHAQHLWYLNDEFLQEMCSLIHLKILNLHHTRISTVPSMISGCSSLQSLIITSQKLQRLPKLPSSLKRLVVSPAKFPVLPDLSNLVHLDHLEVWRGESSNTSWMFTKEAISPWEDARSIDRLPRSLSILTLGWIPELPNFSDFKSLSVLCIQGCPMQHFPDLECLERLRELKMELCLFLESTPDLSRLKRLQKLKLSYLPKLAENPGLGELESLEFLDFTDCNAIEQLPNLSKLGSLRHLKLDGCETLRAVEGLKELKYLKKVEIKQCASLERPDVPAFTKLEIDGTGAAEHTTRSTNPRVKLLWDLLRAGLEKKGKERVGGEDSEFGGPARGIKPNWLELCVIFLDDVFFLNLNSCDA